MKKLLQAGAFLLTQEDDYFFLAAFLVAFFAPFLAAFFGAAFLVAFLAAFFAVAMFLKFNG